MDNDIKLVLTGAIPSTFGTFDERYFGFPGFSDYQGWSNKRTTGRPSAYKKQYRINVPAVMWTAACCEYENWNNATSTWDQQYITKAFWAQNEPFGAMVINSAVSGLFTDICRTTRACPVAMPAIVVFPSKPLCNV